MTSVTEAPTAAVAGDAHWAAKMAKLRARKPAKRRLDVRCDDDALAAARAARLELSVAERRAALVPEDEAAAANVAIRKHAAEQAEAALADTTVEVNLQALPRDVYEALIGEHPPTDDDRAQGMKYDPETFAPALLSACSLDGMPVEDAKELLTTLSQLEAGLLFDTCIVLCETARIEMGGLGNG